MSEGMNFYEKNEFFVKTSSSRGLINADFWQKKLKKPFLIPKYKIIFLTDRVSIQWCNEKEKKVRKCNIFVT